MANDLIIVNQPPWADPWTHPEYFLGITAKRVIAYFIDLLVITALCIIAVAFLSILGIFTLGLAWAMLGLPAALLPLVYPILLIAAPGSATIGMRMMGIRVMSIAPGLHVEGGRPNLFQAFIQTGAFYGSIAVTGTLILIIALFNPRRRMMHDWLAGTLVVNNIDGLP